jgi:lipopolysaccharide/colanic/teichoic acid biosynthesis glycosyltransferase
VKPGRLSGRQGDEMSERSNIFPDSQIDIPVATYLDSRRKRAADIVGAVLGLVILAGVFPFVAVLIKLTSHGPVYYKQARLGRQAGVFMLLKFRTMEEFAERDTGPVWSSSGDERITRVGKFLRKTYIDELPQFWNVLRGEMSLVGPRPERPEMADEIGKTVPDFHSRLGAKPGISGLAQVVYRYGSTVDNARVKLRLDRLYLSTASPGTDLKILARTLIRVVSRRGS